MLSDVVCSVGERRRGALDHFQSDAVWSHSRIDSFSLTVQRVHVGHWTSLHGRYNSHFHVALPSSESVDGSHRAAAWRPASRLDISSDAAPQWRTYNPSVRNTSTAVLRGGCRLAASLQHRCQRQAGAL